MPLLDYYFIKKQSNKKDVIRHIDLSSFKIVFLLLADTIVIQVWISIIKVGQ